MANSRYYKSCMLQEFKVDDDDTYSDCAYLRFGDDNNEHLELVVTSDFLVGLGVAIRAAEERKKLDDAKRAARKAKR